ncbi:hypothetical protein AMTRI_Chr01g102830 [Amborella trichopoda]|uniref:F-box domain-containing protein n=1 Tax=Amborella trichopoda TaxID=13333 RepID=W1NR29_AMBTC|nr:F-box/WD-40 repeat-containing protein At5g21040 [Amborella trichopoda]ERM97289.1 hypothetical protein AMTR_s00119p00137710 [Amborella trichopoda]|eukprot:XP_006829873.1 F-box/WD-40 repeat-containing protein At5g21040 [Amborella trichopoda]
MAYECHGSLDQNLYFSEDNNWNEERSTTCDTPHIPFCLSNISTRKENPNSSPLSTSQSHQPKREISIKKPFKDSASLCPTSITSLRSITDLPPALISEILHHLDPRELGIVSCVSTLFRKFASDHHGWKDYYCERWGLPMSPSKASEPEIIWKELYVEREKRSKTFMGRYEADMLCGHTEAVRSVFLLASANIIITGGYDSVVRLWSMEECCSLAHSRHFGCTLRAIVADDELLVVGGTDAFLLCWRTIPGLPHLFDVSGLMNQSTEFRLWEHGGPISCLAMDLTRIYSGSWDMTVRVWDRSTFKCSKILRHADWVFDVVLRGPSLATVAGSDLYIWNISNGKQLEVISNIHNGIAYSLAQSLSGSLLFSGGEDGSIHMFEVQTQMDHGGLCLDCYVKKGASWIPHNGAVRSLSFEFPWLVSCSDDGKLALMDVRKLLKSSRGSSFLHSKSTSVEPPQRMLHGSAQNLFSVAIGADRIVCGGEENNVRVWNFSQALENEKRMKKRRALIASGKRNIKIEQCSIEAKRDGMERNRGTVWCRRGTSSKLKA